MIEISLQRAGLVLLALAAFAGCDNRGSWGDGGTPGRDAGPQCTGVSFSCSTVSPYSCSNQRGCRLEGECGGVASSCYSQFSSFSCNDQEGCYWGTYDDDCSGSARSCYSMYTSTSCEDQEGCSWRETCEGVAYPCSLLAPWECGLQLGCRLQ